MNNINISTRLILAFGLAYLFMLVIAFIAFSGWEHAHEIIITLLVVGGCVGTIIGVYFVRSITQPLSIAIEITKKLHQGI